MHAPVSSPTLGTRKHICRKASIVEYDVNAKTKRPRFPKKAQVAGEETKSASDQKGGGWAAKNDRRDENAVVRKD